MLPDRLSRRDALRLSSITLVGLAGCTGASSEQSPNEGPSNPENSAIPTETASERSYSHTVHNSETVKVRNPDGLPAIVSTSNQPERDILHHSGVRENAPGWDQESWFVTSPEGREALKFPEDTTTGVEEATRFISNTDLSEETLAVHQYQNVDCMTVNLAEIKWDRDERAPEGAYAISMQYDETRIEEDCKEHSDSNFESTDKKEIHAILSRIPVDIREVTATTILM